LAEHDSGGGGDVGVDMEYGVRERQRMKRRRYLERQRKIKKEIVVGTDETMKWVSSHAKHSEIYVLVQPKIHCQNGCD